MKVSRFAFNMFGVNTYVVYDPETRDAAVIDPGMIDDEERHAIDNFIERNHLKVRQLINTHAHLDHLFGNDYIRNKYNVKTSASELDSFLSDNLTEQAAQFHLKGVSGSAPIDVKLVDGDEIPIGAGLLKVIAVPGHSPGSLALYDEKDGWVITGDALFQGSIGRTDLPGGNHAQLVKAITEKLLSLPDNVVVLPGHGPETTIGSEKISNPYL